MDSVSNHVKPYWPTEATTASDSEDPGGPERLRVETKVNVELHAENKLNHAGDKERDPQPERERPTVGNSRDTASPNQTFGNHHHHQQQQPEQRKGAERGKNQFASQLTNCQFCDIWNVFQMFQNFMTLHHCACTYFEVQQSGFAVPNCPSSSSFAAKSYRDISSFK